MARRQPEAGRVVTGEGRVTGDPWTWAHRVDEWHPAWPVVYPQRAAEVRALLVAHPQGLRIRDIAEALSVPQGMVRTVTRVMRWDGLASVHRGRPHHWGEDVWLIPHTGWPPATRPPGAPDAWPWTHEPGLTGEAWARLFSARCHAVLAILPPLGAWRGVTAYEAAMVLGAQEGRVWTALAGLAADGLATRHGARWWATPPREAGGEGGAP